MSIGRTSLFVTFWLAGPGRLRKPLRAEQPRAQRSLDPRDGRINRTERCAGNRLLRRRQQPCLPEARAAPQAPPTPGTVPKATAPGTTNPNATNPNAINPRHEPEYRAGRSTWNCKLEFTELKSHHES
jgi:hypothetical protein